MARLPSYYSQPTYKSPFVKVPYLPTSISLAGGPRSVKLSTPSLFADYVPQSQSQAIGTKTSTGSTRSYGGLFDDYKPQSTVTTTATVASETTPAKKSFLSYEYAQRPEGYTTGKELGESATYVGTKLAQGLNWLSNSFLSFPDSLWQLWSGVIVGNTIGLLGNKAIEAAGGKQIDYSKTLTKSVTDIVKPNIDTSKFKSSFVKNAAEDINKGTNIFKGMTDRSTAYYSVISDAIKPRISVAAKIMGDVAQSAPQTAAMALPHGSVMYALSSLSGNISEHVTGEKPFNKEMAYALWSADIDIGSESIFGLFGKASGILEGALSKALGKKTVHKTAQLIWGVVANAAEEGAEELIAYPFQSYIDWRYNFPDAPMSECPVFKHMDKWGQAGFVGFISGGMFSLGTLASQSPSLIEQNKIDKLKRQADVIMDKPYTEVTKKEVLDFAEDFAEVTKPLSDQVIASSQASQRSSLFDDYVPQNAMQEPVQAPTSPSVAEGTSMATPAVETPASGAQEPVQGEYVKTLSSWISNSLAASKIKGENSVSTIKSELDKSNPNYAKIAQAVFQLQQWQKEQNISMDNNTKRALQSIQGILSDNNIEILDLTGQKYDAGLAVELAPQMQEVDLDSNLVISRMVKPIVLINGKVVSLGMVEVRPQTVQTPAQPPTEPTGASAQTVSEKKKETPARTKAINQFANKLVADGIVSAENIETVKPLIKSRLESYEQKFPNESLAGSLTLVRGLFTADKTNKEYSDEVFASGKATWANAEIFIKRMGKEAFVKKYPELAYIVGAVQPQAQAQPKASAQTVSEDQTVQTNIESESANIVSAFNNVVSDNDNFATIRKAMKGKDIATVRMNSRFGMGSVGIFTFQLSDNKDANMYIIGTYGANTYILIPVDTGKTTDSYTYENIAATYENAPKEYDPNFVYNVKTPAVVKLKGDSYFLTQRGVLETVDNKVSNKQETATQVVQAEKTKTPVQTTVQPTRKAQPQAQAQPKAEPKVAEGSISQAEEEYLNTVANASNDLPDKAQQLHFLPEWSRPVGSPQVREGALNAYKGVLDPDVNKNIKDAHDMPETEKSVKTWLARQVKAIQKAFFRGAWGDLEWADGETRRLLRILQDRYRITAETTGNEIVDIYNPIGKENKFAMDMYMLLPDIIEDIDLGKYSNDNLPFGFKSIQQVYLEYERIKAAVNDPMDTSVKKAKQRLVDITNSKIKRYMTMAKNLGFNPSRLFLRKFYMHHEIIEYLEKSKNDPEYKKAAAGIFKTRQGSTKPYVTDSAIAYFLAFRKMEEDMAKMELMTELQRQDKKGTWGAKANGDFIIEEGYEKIYTSDFGFVFPENLLKQNAVQYVKDFVSDNKLKTDDPKVVKMMSEALETERNMYYVVPERIAKSIREAFLPNKEIGWAGDAYLWVKQAWQQWMLKAPHLALKYQTKNALGDTVHLAEDFPGALKLKYTGKATAELKQYLYGTHEVTPRLLRYIKEGGLFSGLADVTLSDFRKAETFDFYDNSGNLKPDNAIKYTFGKSKSQIEKFYMFREQILRYAGFNYLIDNTLNNERRLPADGFYYRSKPEEIKSIRSVVGRAYKMINDTMGAYDDVSVAGRKWAKWVYSFWRFAETNNRGYFRELINIWHKDPDLVVEAGRSYADRFKATTKIGKMAAWKLGKVVLKIGALSLAPFLWNRLVMRDEDDDIPEWAKKQSHITLGRFGGKVLHITDTSTLFNALRWIGQDDIYENIQDIITGNYKLNEELLELIQQPKDEMLNGALPLFQALLELNEGKNFYSNAAIYDKWGYVFDFFALGGVYKTLTGKPKKDEVLWGMTPIKSAMANESSFWKIYELRDDYLKSIDEYRGGTYGKNKKDLALYNFRTAIRFDDKDAALRYLKEYAILSKAEDANELMNNIKSSARALNPLQSLGEKKTVDFISTLSGNDLKTFKDGMRFYFQYSKDMTDFVENALSGRAKDTNSPEKP